MKADLSVRPTKKIDRLKMIRMISEKKTNVEMAKEFGVTASAVTQMRDSIIREQNKFSPDIHDSELSGKTIDALFQLRQMNTLIIEELNRCKKFIDREEKDIDNYLALKQQADDNPNNLKLREKIEKLVGPTAQGILRIQGNVISIAGEVRKQIELQLKIAETVYSVSMMAEFQEEVIDVLKEVDPKIRDEVVKRLKDKRKVRGLLKDMSKDREA